MKKNNCLLVLLIVTVECNSIRTPRDISELFHSGSGVQPRPAFWQQPDSQNGYDYPRPGISTRPIFRDPEPIIPQEQYPLLTRPVYPDLIRPSYPDQNYIPTRPVVYDNGYNYHGLESFDNRIQPSPASGKILWPLFNKIAGVFNGQGQYPGSYPGQGIGYPGQGIGYPGQGIGFPGIGYPGSNSIGYPGGNGYPGYPGKFPILNNLLPNKFYNYQRIQAASAPASGQISVNSVGDGGYNGYADPGVSSLGDDTVIVGGVPVPTPAPEPQGEVEGYSYPNPNEVQPPFELPDGLQFRAQPAAEQNDSTK